MQKRSIVLLLGIVVLLALSGEFTRDRADHGGLQLEPPSFVALVAEAQAQEKGVNFLQQEAGIAAYVKVGQAIDLAQVRGAFKTTETVSDQYIIGEVALPGLPEEAHPHVYVNKEGWIVAYYSKDEPASKIMYWGKVTVGTTLQEAIRQVLSPVKTEEIKYYNFKYPNANRIMMITETIEKGNQGDSINITIPQGLRLFEASWSLYSPSDYSSWLQIDSTQIGSLGGKGVLYGDLTSSLRVDFRHTIQIRAQYENYEKSFVVILIYQV
jgi:hypothetical protein